MDRKKIIIKLRNKKYTYQAIGNILGISRQRVHRILNSSPQKIKDPILTYFNNSRLAKVLKDKYSPNEIYQIYKQNPQLKNLTGIDYLSEIVRIRDNHACQICGKIWEKGKRKLDIHHIDEKDENNKSYANYKKFDKMITLCHKCHLNLDHIKEKMRKNRGIIG